MDEGAGAREVSGLFRMAVAAVSRGDACGVRDCLRACDAAPEGGMNSAEARFATGIIAMEAGEYLCAAEAWSDGRACWSEVEGAVPGVPSPRRAADALRECCLALAGVRRGGPAEALAARMSGLL